MLCIYLLDEILMGHTMWRRRTKCQRYIYMNSLTSYQNVCPFGWCVCVSAFICLCISNKVLLPTSCHYWLYVHPTEKPSHTPYLPTNIHKTLSSSLFLSYTGFRPLVLRYFFADQHPKGASMLFKVANGIGGNFTHIQFICVCDLPYDKKGLQSQKCIYISISRIVRNYFITASMLMNVYFYGANTLCFRHSSTSLSCFCTHSNTGCTEMVCKYS